jgi:predicted Zn finger-like uncharacterized protein
MKVSCPNCQKSYAINSEKIPSNVTAAKCRACGHTISLNQRHAVKSSPDDAIINITCLNCRKTYRVNRSRIPKNIKAVKCKSCSHAISLVPGDSTVLPPQKALEINSASRKLSKRAKSSPPLTPSPAKPSAPLWRKSWLLAAVLALIVVGVGVIYFGPQFAKFLARSSEKDQNPNKETQFQTADLSKPFLNLDINLPLALEALERGIPNEKKDANYANTVSAINSLDANRLQIYLYPDPKHTVLPVAVLHSSKPNRLETKIKKAIAIHTILEQIPDGSYRLKKDAIPAKMQKDFPIDIYRVLFWKNGAVIAPKSFLPGLENPENLNQTLVAQMAATIETPQNLGSLAIRIPEKS